MPTTRDFPVSESDKLARISENEKDFKSKHKRIEEKLIELATRIPIFLYLTDYRERTLRDIITQLEPNLFKGITGLTVQDFELLVTRDCSTALSCNDAIYEVQVPQGSQP